jgi:crotonobetainyl-CoA:carnitine CoA-transferase CaiB-like acyl-CoA transferase
MPGPLEGLFVLDLSRGIPGGYCTKLLAGLGASVLKAEPPGGDPVRHMPPFKDGMPDPETATAHLHLSMGKRAVTLALETPTGRDIAARLIERADVLVESFAPGQMGEWGLDYATLAASRPELIMTSITPFGQTGPYAHYHGNELIEYSAGGYTYVTGLPDREPIKAGGSQAEYQGGLHAAAGTMAALLMRQLSGEGDHIDVSITEAICFTHAGMAPYLNTGEIFGRVGARLLSKLPRSPYPSTILPCKDGFVHVHWAPSNPPVLGVLTETPRLSEPDVWEAPRGHAEEIDALVTAWLATQGKYEAVEKAQELRLPFTEVLTPADLLDDAQFVDRGFFIEIEHPILGSFQHLGAPFRLSETPWQAARAPLLGEHNGEVYGEWLGLSTQDMAVLRQQAVI